MRRRERNGAVERREAVCPHVRGTVTQHCALNFTITDEEREAIKEAISCCEDITYGKPTDPESAATLRNLLDRLK